MAGAFCRNAWSHPELCAHSGEAGDQGFQRHVFSMGETAETLRRDEAEGEE